MLRGLTLLVKVLRPDWRKLLLFLGLAFICVGGAVQTYAFIDDVGIPEPPLYDLLRPYDLWTPWILFTLPLHLLSAPFCALRDCRQVLSLFPDMGAVKFPLVSVIYSYLMASWTVYCLDRWFRWRGRLRILPLIPIILTATVYLPSIFYHPSLRLLSSFLPVLGIMELYVVSVHGLYRELREVLHR